MISTQKKYNEGTITRTELLEYIKLMDMNKDFKIHYEKFFIVNMNKRKPKGTTYSDYGRFIDMIKYMSYKNSIEHQNGKKVKLASLSKELEFNTEKTCSNFISRLKKNKMLADITLGGIKFLAINPAYAQRNMKVNREIFKLFKDDLKEYFNEYEIKYLEMEDDSIEIDSLICIE